MSKNWYREVLEALNMKKKNSAVHNKLNEASVHSDDAELRALTKNAMKGLKYSSTNTEITPLIEFNSVDTRQLYELCQAKAYPQKEEKEI